MIPVDGMVDEMVDGRGGVRPHWRGVLGVLSALDIPMLAARARRLDEAAEEDGVAPDWRCDPVPLPLTADEFTALADGLAQRATLLDAVLADIYGPQALLAEGAIPPALVHANPGYLRACRSDAETDGGADAGAAEAGRHLLTYTADLVRGPDRRWRVLADRTGGAVGVGYARETRRLLARVLPELFRSAQVQQLRPFFEAWQEALLRLGARADGAPPVVAMMTPGPADPHWPEHLALSRDLACALVEARDLTVRGGVLSIKTLGGLQPVDVLMRRVPGAGLDPLELAWTGAGVTGLLDAIRSGSVRVLNHPGAAAVEAPGFAAFLPALARRLLGEALRLPGTEAVWLGDEAGRRAVMAAPDRWSVRPALDGAAAPRRFDPSSAAWAALQQEVEATPWGFVGWADEPPSRAPCLGPDGLTPRPVALRMFLVHDGEGWRTLQGGLARVLTPGEHVVEALPAGAVFKDVWVLREESGLIVGPEPAPQARLPIRRGTGELPSRVADDFYWLGRHVERLEAQARLGRAGLLRRARGAPLPREIAELAVLSRCLGAARFPAAEPGATFDEQVRAASQPGGAVMAGLDDAGRLIEALRDRMTIETHAAFSHAVRAARTDLGGAARAGPDGLVHALGGLQRLATTVAGVAAEGMVRGGGRLFLDLGRRIERVRVGGHVLATVLDQPAARIDGTLRLVLELFDSAITYRGRYLGVLQPAPVLDLVLADTGNPRALAFQFETAAVSLENAGDPELADAALEWQRRVQAVVDRVEQSADPARETGACAGALAEVGDGAAALSERITRRFFALLPKQQSVGLETA